MIKDLLPHPSVSTDRMIKGCQVLVPETLFCREGKFDFILTNDREFCMAIDTKTKLTPIKLRVKFYDVVRERKRDTMPLGLSRIIDEKLNP